MGQKLCEDKRKTCCDLYLGTDHVLLDKVELEVLESLERDTVTEVIKEIDSKLKEAETNLIFRTRMVNVGNGVPMYLGYNLKLGHQFKTLKGSEIVKIKEDKEEIVFDIDVDKIPNKQDFKFSNIGNGEQILKDSYKNGNTFHATFRSIRSNDFSHLKDGSETIIIDYKKPDKEAITELKTYNFYNYVELVREARRIANSKV